MVHLKRVLRLRRKLRSFDALLVTSSRNVQYLCGFTGSAGFIVLTRDADLFVTDFRYKEQAASEVTACEVRVEKRPMVKVLKSLSRGLKIKNLGFEPSMEYSTYSELKDAGLAPSPMGDVIERMRERKGGEEIAHIEEAVRRAEDAFVHIKPYIRTGVTERSIALRLERKLKELGSKSLPFDIIVASGPNSSRPHAGATDRKLAPGDLVTIDWGAESQGYCSDMTRTFILSGGDKLTKKKRIYSVVKRANRSAIKKLKKGARLKDVDSSARLLIDKAGYGEFFGHGLGHGVGLDVHELPRLAPNARGTLKSGMVVTIEPGIYLPGVGGVRIEDMAYVTHKSALIITKLPVELEILA